MRRVDSPVDEKPSENSDGGASPMNLSLGCVVIVDGCSHGSVYAKEFKKLGYTPIHVQTLRELPGFYQRSFVPTDYEENIVFDGKVDNLMEALSKYEIKFIIAGSEYAVDLVEMVLSKNNFGVPSNDLRVPGARRNKHTMSEVLRGKGLRVIPEIVTSEAEKAMTFAAQPGIGFPIVVKSLDSGGSVDFRLCQNNEGIQRAFDAMLHAQNFLNLQMTQLLVQKYMQGTEYAINTVSCDGKHVITDIQKYTKGHVGQGKRMYLQDELQTAADIATLGLKFLKYISDVLDALGIKYGPAHTEIMVMEDGPVLVELAARPGGGISPSVMKECVPIAQMDLSVLAYADPDGFAKYDASYFYKTNSNKLCTYVQLISHHAGEVNGIHQDLLKQLKQLPTFQGVFGLPEKGMRIEETVDLKTTCGCVYLIGSREQMNKDYECIRELEKAGLIMLAAPALEEKPIEPEVQRQPSVQKTSDSVAANQSSFWGNPWVKGAAIVAVGYTAYRFSNS